MRAADLLVGTGPEAARALAAAAEGAARAASAAASSEGPGGGLPHQARAAIAAIDLCPERGLGFEGALEGLDAAVLRQGVRPADPSCVAHLHCATLVPAAAAELIVGATNQSMDSFDQAPAATLLEDRLVAWLGDVIGLGATTSGVLTAGGTASNLLGLTLARERALRSLGGGHHGGLPVEAGSWRIITSVAAHDSVRRAAWLLGLGAEAVVAVATDRQGRMDVRALDAAVDTLAGCGLRPIALVGTAGTTDLGAIDPIDALADRAAACGAWLHVDAAVGSALALSPRLAPALAGVHRADSVTADLHKLWWMPIGASALLVARGAELEWVGTESDYLNRAEDRDQGVLNLVGRSLDTSRRFDALKVVLALRAVGRQTMAAMVEAIWDLTRLAADAVRARTGARAGGTAADGHRRL